MYNEKPSKNMTPKEKAKELMDRFFNEAIPDAVENNSRVPIACALICVDEIINVIRDNSYETDEDNGVEYWIEVKNEINKFQ